MKKTNKEVIEWLLENRIDERGELNLYGLNFSAYNLNVDISGMVVVGNLYQDHQAVHGELYQNEQIVELELYQNHQEVYGGLIQSNQTVHGDLWQDEQIVNGRIFQDEERVIQDCQDIKNDNNVNLFEEDIKGIK